MIVNSNAFNARPANGDSLRHALHNSLFDPTHNDCHYASPNTTRMRGPLVIVTHLEPCR